MTIVVNLKFRGIFKSPLNLVLIASCFSEGLIKRVDVQVLYIIKPLPYYIGPVHKMPQRGLEMKLQFQNFYTCMMNLPQKVNI